MFPITLKPLSFDRYYIVNTSPIVGLLIDDDHTMDVAIDDQSAIRALVDIVSSKYRILLYSSYHTD